jgi:hypothetical protein
MRAVRVLLTGVLCMFVAGGCSSSGPSPLATESAPTESPAGPRVTAEPTEPPDTAIPADTPSPEEAYQQLLAAIPQPIATSCRQAVGAGHRQEPGEYATAECSLPAGGLAARVTYRLFDGSTSMSTYFNAQLAPVIAGGRARTPGCGQGANRDMWDNGLVQCFKSTTGTAQIQWTHDQLYVYAIASRDDADFARLQQFWMMAGPVAP